MTAEITEKQTEKAWDEGVRGRMRLFVLHYCTDERCFMCGTKAYQAAYRRKNADGSVKEIDDNSAAVNAHKLLRKTNVKTAIQKLFKITQTEVDEQNVYRILHDLTILAMYNPADIIDEQGALIKPLSELGNLAKCVEQIQTIYTKSGEACTVVRLANRHKALTVLMKYLNLVRDETPVQAIMPIALIADKTNITAWKIQNAHK